MKTAMTELKNIIKIPQLYSGAKHWKRHIDRFTGRIAIADLQRTRWECGRDCYFFFTLNECKLPNLTFCRPLTKVLWLLHTHTHMLHTLILSSLCLSLCLLTPEPEHLWVKLCLRPQKCGHCLYSCSKAGFRAALQSLHDRQLNHSVLPHV